MAELPFSKQGTPNMSGFWNNCSRATVLIGEYFVANALFVGIGFSYGWTQRDFSKPRIEFLKLCSYPNSMK